MSEIVLQFVGADDPGSRAIQWFSQGICSHVDAVLDSGELLGSRSDSVGGKPPGVQIRPADYEAFSRVVRIYLPAPDEMVSDFYALIRGEIGKPYDSEGILAFISGRDWHDSSAWFCSELQGAMLERCGYFASSLATPSNKLTPAGLLLACSARVPVAMPSP